MMGLQSWAKNRLNGTNEAVFFGGVDKVDHLVDHCYKGHALQISKILKSLKTMMKIQKVLKSFAPNKLKLIYLS